MSGKISNKKYKDAEATQLFPDDPHALPRARRDLPMLLWLLVVSFVVYIMAATLIDPYKVFHIIDFNKRNFELSARYNKIEYLKENPKQGFIFGTSRANGLPTDTASALTGLNFYNMTSPGDSYKGTYQKIKWVLENQPAKHLIISLDYAKSMEILKQSNPYGLINREHPEVSGENPISFFWPFLWAHPKVFAYTVYGNLVRKGTWWWWDRETGHYHFLEIERDLKENPDRLFKNRAKITAIILATWPRSETTSVILDNVAWIIKALQLAETKGVKTTVILNPNYPGMLPYIGKENYTNWRRDMVANIDNLWDFSTFTGATCKDENWFDTSHYAFSLGRIFLNVVLAPNGDIARGHSAISTAAKESKDGVFGKQNRCARIYKTK